MAHISNGDLEDAPSLGQGREEASVSARIHSRTAALSYLSGPNSDLTRRCSQAHSSSGAPCLWRDGGRLAGKAPRETEHAGSIEVWGFAARQHGNPSPVFAHQEKPGSHTSPRVSSPLSEDAVSGTCFSWLFGANLIKEPYGISKCLAHSRHCRNVS